MRIRRRYAAILAIAAVAALAAAGAAFAVTNNVSTATFKVTPNTGLSKTTFKNAALNVHTHTTFLHPGDKANGGFVKNVKLNFDSDLKFNTGAVPVCNKNLANTNEQQAMALCGSSLIGKGTAQATSTANATIPGCVIAFNGPKNGAGQPTIILHSRFVIAPPCPNPSTSTAGSVDAILSGTLVPANKAGYGKALNVPNIDTQPLPLKDFVTTVQKLSYVQARCSATPLRMQTVFTYSGTGQTPDTVNATQACSN
jgi:hypothetical protein